MKITKILAGALLLTGSMFAATITSTSGPEGSYGNAGASVVIGTASAATESVRVTSKEGSASSSATKEANGYEWVLSWNVDPTLSWSYTTITNGFQSVDFFIPVVGGSYDQIFNSGGYAITGTKNSAGAGITGFKVEAIVPYNTTIVPQGLVTVPNTTGVKGSLSKSDDNTNSGGIGPFVPFGPSPAVTGMMGVRVSFTAILSKGDQLSLNGTLTIEKETPPVPEPATFGLIGAALVGLGVFARRRA
ncbi:MAG: PEP-CTERM sorting domain-containing protein [Acidobacteria bacterium]|nr:PEP-CTERM sorting domain-containing protein [Acidobacteriota bacterium]